MKNILALILAFTPTAALAENYDSQAGYSHERTCFKTEYREEYIPGTEDRPGYVNSWKDTVEVPCDESKLQPREEWEGKSLGYNRKGQYVGKYGFHRQRGGSGSSASPSYRRHVTIHEEVDDNSCVEGTLIGGLLGGGIGATLSRGDGRWWAIPLGVASGAMVGCHVDGG